MQDRKQTIAKLIVIAGVSEEEIAESIAVPSDPSMGDFALPCFKFAKAMRKSPAAIAKELAEQLENNLPPPFVKMEAVNGYLNFFIDKQTAAKAVINEIIKNGGAYGDCTEGAGKTVCIDYSSINIAKPFHIGHLLTTVIGGSLYRIFEKIGYKCVGINHLGDWGTQFGKLIVAFREWSSEERLSKFGMRELTDIYVKFHAEAENNPELLEKARLWFKRIEDGEGEALRLFGIFKEITLREVQKTYQRLKITFDSYNGEAFYNDKMQPILDELAEKGLLMESNGAKVVELSDYNMPPCLLVKADGATLYATRDLAAACYRKATYDFSKCLYVVAYQQNLHFKQFFKVLELMGKDWAKDLAHVAFGMVSLEDGAMSTRKGKVVLLEDVLDLAVKKSLAVIEEKSPDLIDKEKVAEEVGVGAVIFSALYNNRIKDMVFSYDKVLSFEGETGPYVQYTNARCRSVLEKAGGISSADADYEGLNNVEGHAIIALLERFPEVVREAGRRYEPSYIGRFLVDLSQEYNRFYFAHRILNEPKGIKTARVMLTEATHILLKEGLRLIGVGAPPKM